MLTNNNIVSFRAHHTKDSKELSTQHKKLIASCRIILTNSLPKCFVFLDNLDDILFKLADQAKNNLEQSEYFAAMRGFRIQQSDLKNEFIRLVINDFDTFFSTSIDTDSSSIDDKPNLELAILKNDDLEENIAITRIATKSNALFGHELAHLSQRFAHLINVQKIADNPLAAENIASHLKEVISPITSNLTIKLQAYKQFEQQAIGELNSLCLALNKALIKNEILPNLAQNNRPRKNSAIPLPPFSPQLASNSSNMMNAKDEQDTSTMFEQLRQFINRERPSPIQSENNSSFTIANQQSILSALSQLQQLPSGEILPSQNGQHQLPELGQLLARNLQAEAQSVSHLDEDTIDVIDLLFEFILEDKVIPVPIRAMLARLQIPMLKVAISDKKFFSTKNHPARHLLNNLAKISTAWSQQKSSQQDLIQGQIDSVVNTILTEFDTDISLFIKLDIQVKQFIEQQVHSSTATEQRIVKVNKGQEKLASAQQEVDSVISEHLSQYSHLPKVVISLIDDGLKHVLKLRLIQNGLDSPEWRDSIKLLEKLLWSVAPKPDHKDRKKLLEAIPHLVNELQSILSGASFNQAKIKAHFKQLQTCHLHCINGDHLQQEILQAIESRPDERNIIEKKASYSTIAAKEKVISDEKSLEKATNLKVGTWLEVTEKNASNRMKFSWRSNITGRCLFVTYQGLKAADLSVTELAALFQKGQAQIIAPSEPLMDRALVSMMAVINNQPGGVIK
jgi:hypothetical protein